MITCSVCGTANHDLAVVCSSCKSFIQSKVDNLNLFETIWGLIESPRLTFRKIVLARHKNYTLLLSSLLGISTVYAVLWYGNLGHFFSNVLTLTGLGLLIGPVIGIGLVLLLSAVMLKVARTFGGTGTLKNIFAVVAYAGVPVVLSLIFVYPIEIAIFGPFFFDNNPPPLVINPTIYVILIGLDAVACLWSWLLLVEGTIVANALTRLKSAIAVLALAVLTGCTAYVARVL